MTQTVGDFILSRLHTWGVRHMFGYRKPATSGRRGHNWIYVGAVGTGSKEKDAAYLKETLDTLKTRTPVVPLKGKNCVLA